jgi:hypothetical protein
MTQLKLSDSDIKKIARQALDRFDEAIINRLQFAGEKFVANARSNGNYKDRTGNLRSSIGYVVLKNGLQLVGSDWILIKEGAEGIIAGKRIIEEIASKYPTGYILICVAGEDYAAAVEAKGYDVITSSALQTQSELKNFLQKLISKI